MKTVRMALGAAAALLGAGCAVSAMADQGGATHEAQADIRTAAGQVVAHATLTQEADGLRLHVAGATGLSQGVHGIHIHTVGRCDGPGFASAGGHWNPTGHQHGSLNPQGALMGDLPNLTIDGAGHGELDALIAGGRLAAGPNMLIDDDGAAIVIHAGPDDYRTDPAGNSGGRIACGVIR
jgi:Cu-Zn family superoxide dismutase